MAGKAKPSFRITTTTDCWLIQELIFVHQLPQRSDYSRATRIAPIPHVPR